MMRSHVPVIEQFLAGRPEGPISMDEMADATVGDHGLFGGGERCSFPRSRSHRQPRGRVRSGRTIPLIRIHDAHRSVSAGPRWAYKGRPVRGRSGPMTAPVHRGPAP